MTADLASLTLPPIPTTEELERGAVAVPERRGRALLGWIAEPDVRAAFYATSVTSPASAEDFVAAWRAQHAARPTAAPAVSGSQFVPGLPGPLTNRGAALCATEQFRIQYQPFGAAFATVMLSDLITPQWWVDTSYVDELAAGVPAADDIDGLFQFSFATGHLARPMLMGTNAAAFASPRRDLGGFSPLRVARYAPDRVTFEFDVTPRPNWVWLATVPGAARPVILNGVHHLLALLQAGRKEAFCLIRAAQSVEELQAMGMNLQDPGLFKRGQLMAPRPPLLRDYLNDETAAPVNLRAVDQYMRLIVQPEIGVVPRGE